MSSGKVNVYVQVSLLASLKILQFDLMALKLCKMTLFDILEPVDLEAFKTLSRDYLEKIESFEGEDDGEESVEVRY